MYSEALASSPDDREEVGSDAYISISICDNRHLGGGPYCGQYPARASDNHPTLYAFLLDLPAQPHILLTYLHAQLTKRKSVAHDKNSEASGTPSWRFLPDLASLIIELHLTLHLSMASVNAVPPGAWDCHVHCFDPAEFVFKSSRTYTPQPASVAQMFENVLTERAVLVQATIEDGPSGLVSQLTTASRIHPERIFRGIIIADKMSEERLNPGRELDRMHEAGVRCIRVHGSHGGSGDDLEWAYNQLLRAARLYPVKHLGWAISAQFSLSTWSGLADRLLMSERGGEGGSGDQDLATVKILADHNACTASKDIGSPQLGAVMYLLTESSRFFIKVGAFYRREPLDMRRMRPVVELFASAAPDRVLWGSDWPHVDVSRKGLDPTPHLSGVDAAEELRVLESWLSPENFAKMLVQNPARVFG